MINIKPSMKIYEEELPHCKNISDLNNFTSLIGYLSSFYQEQLRAQEQDVRKKQPFKRDEIQIAR